MLSNPNSSETCSNTDRGVPARGAGEGFPIYTWESLKYECLVGFSAGVSGMEVAILESYSGTSSTNGGGEEKDGTTAARLKTRCCTVVKAKMMELSAKVRRQKCLS